ncbi:MAG TPA: DUF6297 family protein [Streptosporangiaceae bacterium]
MSATGAGSGGLGELGAPGAPAMPGRVPLRRLRAGSRSQPQAGRRLSDIYLRVFLAALAGALAAGSARPLARLWTGPGWAVPGAAGHLFAAAAVLLLLGLLVPLLGKAGPVTASSAFRFWLLAAPVRRRDLLRRRFIVLAAATAVAGGVAGAVVAHAGSVAVLPTVAMAVLAAITVTTGAVWAQVSQVTERLVHVIGQAMKGVAVLGFGSLATGTGRSGANSALHVPLSGLAVLLTVLSLAALACGWCAYRALDRIDASVLRRGQGLWTAGHVTAVSMDAFMLADFLADQHARAAGRVRPARMGPNLATALARSQWRRIRRRPYLLARTAVAAVVWWGCRPILPGPALDATALIIGYCLVLPLAGTLRQLASSPGLRAQFAPRDRWLARASATACLLGAAAWTAIILPGLTLPGKTALAVIIPLGITAAVWRTVTRPPLDYTFPLVPTPFGDLPLDLWRQQLRGLLLLTMLIVLVTLAR